MKSSGHHVAITGGSRGIGLGLARKFLAEGNKVLIIAHDPGRLARVAAEEPGFLTFAADLAGLDGIERVAAFVEAEFPAINVLVNNAGLHHAGDLGDGVTTEQMISEIAVNVTAPVVLTQKLLKFLRRNAPGAVINVSSSLGLAPKQSAPVYSASKAFVQSFSLTLGYQLEASNIRVFDLIPPAVDTDMMAGRMVQKMQPRELAEAFWPYWLNDKTEAPIGRVRRLKLIQRLWPGRLRRMLRGV